MIKAIIFDVGGVLIDHPWPAMIDHYVKHLNADRTKLYEAMKEFSSEWQLGTIPETIFWERICKKLNIRMPKSELLWLDGFKKAYKEKDEIFLLIEQLKKKGYKIGLLSNTELPIMHFLIEKKYKHFDVFIYSCGIKLAKPDKEIYEETLRQLKVTPTEAIFIDDTEENIEGAQRVGMKGILFTNTKRIETLLTSLLNGNYRE